MTITDNKNITNLLLSNGTGNIVASGSVHDLVEGEVAFVLDGVCVAYNSFTAGAGTRFQYAVYEGGRLWLSDMINYDDITSKTGSVNVHAVQKTSYIGYNGTTGEIDAAASTDYVLNVLMKFPGEVHAKQDYIKQGVYRSATSGYTEETVATGLLASLLKNFSREKINYIKFERVAANTSQAVLTGSATMYKLTKDSTTVNTYIPAPAALATGLTASTASVTDGTIFQAPATGTKTFSFTALILGTGAGGHKVYIGNTVYLVADAGSAADNATAIETAINAGTQATAIANAALVTITLNNEVSANITVLSTATNTTCTWANVAVTPGTGDIIPVSYLINGTTSGAATFELDHPWQGETCYFYETTTPTTGCGILTASGAWGIKGTGRVNPIFRPGVENYSVLNWEFILHNSDDWGATTTETTTVNPVQGVGNYKQIAELEYQCSGNLGKHTKAGAIPQEELIANYDSSLGYDIATIVWRKTIAGLGHTASMPQTLHIATNTAVAAGDLHDKVKNPS